VNQRLIIRNELHVVAALIPSNRLDVTFSCRQSFRLKKLSAQSGVPDFQKIILGETRRFIFNERLMKTVRCESITDRCCGIFSRFY